MDSENCKVSGDQSQGRMASKGVQARPGWSWVNHPIVNIVILVGFITLLLLVSPENGIVQNITISRAAKGGGIPPEKLLDKDNIEKKYFGSRLLSFLCGPTSLEIDQVNFITCQLMALVLSFGMRRIQYNKPKAELEEEDEECNSRTRRIRRRETTKRFLANEGLIDNYASIVRIRIWFTLLAGLFICYFCFGHEILHVIGLSGISYGLIKFFMRNQKELKDDEGYETISEENWENEKSLRQRRKQETFEEVNSRKGNSELQARNLKVMPWVVFVSAMGYLSVLHIRRLQENNYSLDITGPMMVLTQKVTSLAFSIRDGVMLKRGKNRKAKSESSESEGEAEAEMTELLQTNSVSRMPTTLEYASFIFQFQSMLAGPLVFYGDYIQFIRLKPTDIGDRRVKWPSPPLTLVCQKIIYSVFFAVLFLKLGPIFPINRLRGAEFLDGTGFLFKIFFLTCVTTIERAKYYHAWILADAVCNASGLGYDWKKKNWALISNVHPMQFEFGTNLKESMDNWNIGTGKWLRHVVYERIQIDKDPKSKGKNGDTLKIVLTYLTSAMWHGFFAGYYLTFFSGALFTSAARTVRRYIRPYFVLPSKSLSSRLKRSIYDILTFTTTRLVLAYVTFTFIILDFSPSIELYKRMYFFLHVAAFSVIFIFPYIFKRNTRYNEKARNDKMESKSNSVSHGEKKRDGQKGSDDGFEDFDERNLFREEEEHRGGGGDSKKINGGRERRDVVLEQDLSDNEHEELDEEEFQETGPNRSKNKVQNQIGNENKAQGAPLLSNDNTQQNCNLQVENNPVIIFKNKLKTG